jgi:hypothetical protein
MIGPVVTVISSIRSTVTVFEVLASAPVVVVVAPGLLGGRRYSKGTLQLFALSHGVLSVAMKLTLVVHDHVEVAFEEGGRSWRIRHIGLVRSLARPGASVIVVFSVEVVHDRVFSVDELVDIGHEVANGVCISLMDFLEKLDVGDSLLVVSDDIFVFHTCKSVAVFEVPVSVLTESFITSHPYSGEVVSIARTIVGCLVVGREEARQSCPGGEHSVGRLSSHGSGALPITRGKYPRHVIFVAAQGAWSNIVRLEPYTWVGATVVLLDSRLEVLGVSNHPEMS